jgi:hypothetical protein
MAIKHEDYLKALRVTAQDGFMGRLPRAAHHTGYKSTRLKRSNGFELGENKLNI